MSGALFVNTFTLSQARGSVILIMAILKQLHGILLALSTYCLAIVSFFGAGILPALLQTLISFSRGVSLSIDVVSCAKLGLGIIVEVGQ